MDIGDILVSQGCLSGRQLEAIRRQQGQQGTDLWSALIAAGDLDEQAIGGALAAHFGLDLVQLANRTIPPEVVRHVPAKFARHYGLMPLAIDGAVLTVAFADPSDPWASDDLQTHVGLRIRKVLALKSEIQAAVEHYYGVGATTIERILDDGQTVADNRLIAGEARVEDLERLAGDASVVRLVNEVIQQAIAERATDIHLEHYPDEAKLRYRVDGILRDARVSGEVRHLYPALVSRIKIMSGLDIIERRVPQDGRAKVKVGKLEYDLRVSIMPTINGENIVVRILPTTLLLSLTDLGLSAVDRDNLEGLIRQPNGIIFVTGPTGSGKSTTLYASLKKLNRPDIKLTTIEDPVEYALRGVSQVQVNEKTGLTFARALRSMLRHDPDVIMVGEIRDLETANIATRAALTGHLVLSTLHTNSAAGGAARLMDIGIEPYLIASSVLAFVGQRLVRVVCPKCRQPYELDGLTLARFGQPAQPPVTAYRGPGCEHCEQTGYRGRTGIYEILRIGEELRQSILDRASADRIQRQARELGIPTMLGDGYRKVLAGITSPEEVLRVVASEE